MTSERQNNPKRCCIDHPAGDTQCVFDSGDVDDLADCDEAHVLAESGLCKTDCPHWRHPAGLAAQQRTSHRAQAVRVLIRGDAVSAREGRVLSDFRATMQVAADAAPDFVGDFGHGHFRRPTGR